MQNKYKYIYFTENISTTSFQVDLFSISNWFTQPDKYDSPFINNNIYKYLRFKNNITTTEFQTDIIPLANWFSKPTQYPSPFINKSEEEIEIPKHYLNDEKNDLSNIPSERQELYKKLGYTEDLWDNNKNVDTDYLKWAELTYQQREAAKKLGYTEDEWNSKTEEIEIPLEDLSNIKIGIALPYTGPLESLMPDMAKLIKHAINEAAFSGQLHYVKNIKFHEADTECVNQYSAIIAAQKLLDEGVIAIIGGACSGATRAMASNVTIPNKIPLISPAATFSDPNFLDDNNLVFRTCTPDSRQGIILAEITKKRGIKKVAITYANIDYGKVVATAYKTHAEENLGIEVTIIRPHELYQASYINHILALRGDADALVIIGYKTDYGKDIIEASLELNLFNTFILNEDMTYINFNSFGDKMNSSFGVRQIINDQKILNKFNELSKPFNVGNVFVKESYDAAALILLAIHAVIIDNNKKKADGIENKDSLKIANGIKISNKIQEIANGSGTKIYPGEIGEGLKLLSEGKKINYIGATNVAFDNNGDHVGNFVEYNILQKGDIM